MPSTVIRGGTVIDVDEGTMEVTDVVIRDGVVSSIGPVTNEDIEAADEVHDAQGTYVAPGFIDIHTHVFAHPLFRTTRLEADRIGVRQGVSCLVDTGSSGAATIDAFPEFVHETQRTPAFALVNIGSPGLPKLGGGHSSRPELVSLADTVRAAERHPDWILGVKVLASASHTGAFGLEAVKLARKAAELTGLPLMAHIGNAPPLVDDVLALLRPGDIVTHTYHGKIGGVLTHGGQVLPAFRDAVARGVIVDVGHGRSSFSFATCERALGEGMPVHTISSDLHRGSLDRYAVSLARTMTKLRLLGLTLVEAVRAVTLVPARALGLADRGFGELKPGCPAHITVFAERAEPLELEDSEGEMRTAERWIDPVSVYVAGTRHDREAPV